MPKTQHKTISPKRLSRWGRKKESARRVPYPREIVRPTTRKECRNGIRPCPFVTCKFHLYLDVNNTGSYTVNFPELGPLDLKHTCALDIAEEGEHTLEEIGEILNITRERVRQIELACKEKLEKSIPAQNTWEDMTRVGV